MADIVPLKLLRSIIGRWRSDEDDARSEYHIYIKDGELVVDGKDFLDGETYIISNVRYADIYVEFDTFMNSTGRRGHLVLKIGNDPDKAEMQFTFTDTATATKY